jgi:hypothetical protein
MLEEVHSRPPLLSFSSCIRMRYFESFSAYVEKVKRVLMWRDCEKTGGRHGKHNSVWYQVCKNASVDFKRDILKLFVAA